MELSQANPPDLPRFPAPALPERGFFARIPGSILYPFRHGGLVRWILGSVVICIGFVAGSVMGGQSLMLNGPLLGYLALFLIEVANASGDGRDDVPGWPGFNLELVSEFIMLILTVLLSFLPVILYACAIVFQGAPIDYLVFALYASWFFLPMALIRVCMLRSLEGVKPLPVIQSIFRTLTPYMGLCIVLTFAQFAQGALQTAVSLVPYAGVFLKSLVLFYFLIFQMRLFGIFYYTYRKKLAWFEGIAPPKPV
jgi:hypothetical protein